MTLWLPCAILCAFASSAVCQNATEPTRDLHVMTFIPMTGTIWPGGRALIPALNMALRAVNERADILPGYTLRVTIQDTQCDVGPGINGMYELLYSAPVKLMMVGPVCSFVAEVLAEACHSWNVSQLAISASSPVLSDKRRYPRFFRIVPPNTIYNLANVALFKHFNWNKVALITVAKTIFSYPTDELVKMLKRENIEIISQEIYETDPTSRVQNLKHKDARIILASSYEPNGRRVLCAAYRAGLYGPKIVWIFPGWYNKNWWRNEKENLPCTVSEMDAAIEGSLGTIIYYLNSKEQKSPGGLTALEFEEQRLQQPSYIEGLQDYEFIAPSMYDSVWGSAMALNCTITAMHDRGFTKTLDQFQYSDGDIGDIMTSCLYNLSFTGVSGEIKFDETGDPLKNIKIEQIQGLEKVLVGRYIVEEEVRYLEWFDGGIKWPGNVVPRDSTQVSIEQVTLPPVLYVTMSAVATLGNVLALGLLAFNIYFRKNTFVKLSSPNINNILVCGCLLTYSSVYLHNSYETVVICKLRHFLFATGFTTAFGAMFSKTWRVYKIFCNKNLLRVKINDLHLLAIVAVMVGVMVVILVVWEAVDSLVIETLHLEKQSYETGADAIVIPLLHHCTSTFYYYFLTTMCIMEGAMLAFGAFLSFETRKVRIAALNDARQIGMCLYNVIVLSALVLILSILLDTQIALTYGIFSGFVILGTTTTLLIIFIPKIQSVVHPGNVAPIESTTENSSIKPGTGTGTLGRLSTVDSTAYIIQSVVHPGNVAPIESTTENSSIKPGTGTGTLGRLSTVDSTA